MRQSLTGWLLSMLTVVAFSAAPPPRQASSKAGCGSFFIGAIVVVPDVVQLGRRPG